MTANSATKLHSIIVCGINNKMQLGEKSNNKNSVGDSIINPPLILSRPDPLTIISYSIYQNHSVLITNENIAYAIGSNEFGQISPQLESQNPLFEPIRLADKEGQLYSPVSAVCGDSYTLYLVKNESKLIYCYRNSESKFPLFLNIGQSVPVALFGGRYNSAAIDSSGAIIFIPGSISKSPKFGLDPHFLPNHEKAVSVACCDEFVVALSSTGKVFASPVSGGTLKFSEVVELSKHEIVDISGTFSHCLAVSKDGVVFGRGSNNFGELGISKDTKRFEVFVEIHYLFKYHVCEVFAGLTHSLFKTVNGKVLVCGANNLGQLPLDKKPDFSYIYTPVESTIMKHVTSCIAGFGVSVIFKNLNLSKSPNKRIQDKNQLQSTLNIIDVKDLSQIKMNDEPVGESDQSKVYQVIQERYFALKELKVSLFSSNAKTKKVKIGHNVGFVDENKADCLKNFLHQIEVLNQIDNVNIMKYFAFCYGDKSHLPSIMTEFCPSNLTECVDELSTQEQNKLIFDIAEAMNDAHLAQLIHGDLRPENIFFDENLTLKIGDFELFRILDKNPNINSSPFVAPELLDNSDDFDEKIDVYSFGMLAYYILSGGEIPKVNRNDEDKNLINFPDNFNSLHCEIIGRCLATVPDERPAFIDIVYMLNNNSTADDD